MSDGNIEFGVGVNTQAASAPLDQLQKQLKQTIKDFEHLARVTQQGLDSNSAKSARSGQQYLNQVSRGYVPTGSQSGGIPGVGAPATEAAIRARLAEINTTMGQSIARISEAQAKATVRAIKNTEPAIAATVARAERATSESIRKEADQRLKASQAINARYGEQRQIRQAQIGPASAANEATLQRLGNNGGADILAIQARVLVGYQALSAAFNTVKQMGTFVVQLDKEFRQFQAITSTTNSEMGQVRDKLIAVSEATKFTALEVAQAATVMGQAGFSAREVGDSIEAVTLLATAAGTELAPAVDLVTSTLSIFNLQASQTTDIANTMTAAINGSKLTIDKLALGFQYAGNIAAQVGVTYQELTGVLGALANSGIRSGSTLGTGLRQLLVDIQDPSEKFSATLTRLGLTQQDVDVKSRGLVTVMKTLKDAGFGASEAFEAFEVRAAATYTALANNIDVAVSLQKQFILSSAAAEANAVQMESLANTFAKMSSVLGTMVYNAMEPFIGVVQDVTNAAADMLATLNRVPGLLQVIGLAFVGLGTAIAVSTVGALFAGLARGLPILSTFTRGVAGASTAFMGFGTTVTATTGLMAGFSAVLAANPIGLTLGAIALATTAYYAFGKSNYDAAAAIDALRGSLDALEGDVESSKAEMEAIDQVISNLIERKEELNKDPLLREAKILEVVQQFKELGLEVDASTSSIDELVNALNRIKDVDLGEQIESLGLMVETNRQLVAQLQNASTQKGGEALSDRSGLEASIRGNLSLGGLSSSSDYYLKRRGRRDDVYGNAFNQMFSGENDQALAAIALNRAPIPTDGQAFQGRAGTLSNQIERDKLERDRLQRQQDQYDNLTEIEQDRLEQLRQEIEVRQALLETIQPLVANALALQAAQEAVRNGVNATNRAQGLAFARSTGLDTDILGFQSQQTDLIHRGTAAIQDPKLAADAAAKIASDLEAGFEAALGAITTKADTVRRELEARGYNDGEIDNILNEVLAQDETAILRNSISRLTTTTTEEALKEHIDNVVRRKKEIDAALSNQINLLDNSYSSSEVDNLDKVIKGMLQTRINVQNAVFDEELAAAGEDSTTITEIENRRAEADAEFQKLTSDYAQRILDRKTELQQLIFDANEDAFNNELEDVKEKMSALAKRISETRPGAIMDGLILEYNNLLTSMETLQTSRAANQVNSEMLERGASGEPVGDDAVSALKFFMARGRTQVQAAGIVGNLMAESNLNPNAVGDNGAAEGVAQWHADRRAIARANGFDLKTRESQYAFVDWELRNNEARAGDRLNAAQNPRDAAAAGISYERPRDFTWANPERGLDWNKRYQNTMDLAAIDLGSTSSEAATLAASTATATDRNTRTVGASNARASKAEIDAILASAKASTSPEAILAMAEGVRETYNELVASQIETFKELNKEELAAGNDSALTELENLQTSLNADRVAGMMKVMDEYDRAATAALQKPYEEAQAALAAAQDPANSSRYTESDIRVLQQDVVTKEQAILTNTVAQATERLAIIQREAAAAQEQFGAASEEAVAWQQREAQAILELNEAAAAQKVVVDAAAQSQFTLAEAVASANESWRQSTGLFNANGDMLTQAEQMETVWVTALDGITSSLTNLFVSIGDSTQSAGDKFKAFGKSVIDMFIQLIAKALAYQVVLAAMNAASGGAGGGAMQGVMGLLGKAMTVAPVGAATGEMIEGEGYRDSVIRKVAPGEMILRQSAVKAIGRDKLLDINAMGNRKTSTPGVMDTMSGMAPQPTTTNVWVVSPDQVPALGPNDIVATVSDNIQRRGSLRQLIKSVVSGQA